MKEKLINAITFVFDKIKPKNRSGKKIRMDIIKMKEVILELQMEELN